MLNQVKWTNAEGQTFYGMVAYPEERDGDSILVHDIVLPVSDWVPEKDLVEIPFNFGTYDRTTGDFIDCDEYMTKRNEFLKEAQKTSDELEEFGVGAMFRIQIADGYAYYVVTRVGRENCDVEWRGYCPDNWYDQILGVGATMPIDRIKPLWDRERALKRSTAASRK